MRMEMVSACIVAAAMILAVCAGTRGSEKLYIVHMDKSHMPSTFGSHVDWYKSVMLSVVDVDQRDDVDRKLVYTYDVAMHGFSALLTSAELEAVRGLHAYVESYVDTGNEVLHMQEFRQQWDWVQSHKVGTHYGRRLLTTRSYEFLGLSEDQGLWPQSELGDANDIVVGIIDTGIWPESPSFVEDGMGPVPAKWKGTCEPGEAFDVSLCNRKLIGARYFIKGFLALGRKFDAIKDYNSTRDAKGHGTFIASIIAGQDTPNANYFGYGTGTAKGMAPHVRVSMYKVVWYDSRTLTGIFFSFSDIMQAMEQAIVDGVDIISISLAAGDPIIFSSLKAMVNGVLVVAAGGNAGPKVATVQNAAPWWITVGAATIDRAFVATINLGHGEVIMKGISIYKKKSLRSTPDLILIYGSICLEDTLDPRQVTGNILFCLDSNDVDVDTRIHVAETTGAVAAIIAYDDAVQLPPSVYSMPVVFVNASQSDAIMDYITATTAPIASLEFHITELGSTSAPLLGSFSSVGPNHLFPEIVKPDLVAPGVNIIAACPTKQPHGSCFDLRSGTSFAAPHVAGIAALLKAVHPEWSPAAIKSALMTTAETLDNKGQLIRSTNTSAPTLTPLDVGSGHISPQSASNPGLVYDMGYQEYVNYLCLTNRTKRTDCSNATGSPYDLNLATFAANFFYGTKEGEKQVKSFKRVLTNFGGGGNGVYNAIASMGLQINVTVTPKTLVFNQTNQKLDFTLTMEIIGPSLVTDRVLFGDLLWFDGLEIGDHHVHSPLVAIFPDNFNITNSPA